MAEPTHLDPIRSQKPEIRNPQSEIRNQEELSHFDAGGKAVMVDLGGKEETHRVAVAGGCISMRPETFRLIQEGGTKKGDVLGIARIAGIMAAKRTSELIPLCHPLPLTRIEIRFEMKEETSQIEIESQIETVGRTGVEMEALTAVSVAALTIYDMCKAVDRKMTIESIQLIKKSGGKSGNFLRPQTVSEQ
ncbi:MAG: cyclic pyranopterin monophosphate synthase MoaC [bacterium]|nr:cyclic pyranopterin monophosphate synthase MoaC [bacterium]